MDGAWNAPREHIGKRKQGVIEGLDPRLAGGGGMKGVFCFVMSL